jgi:outer membrane protein OmpA-like peptidoglycan-associated protein
VFRTLSSLAVLIWADAALAAGYSTDVELVRPAFDSGAMFSLQSPQLAETGTLRFGLFTQFEDSPLVLYEGDDQSQVISNRSMTHLGATYAIADIFAIGLTLPVAASWGTETPTLDSDVFGIGDAFLGANVRIVKAGPFYLGADAGVTLPIGTRNAFLGETSPRGLGNLSLMLDFGPVELLGNVGITARSAVVTAEDFALASELVNGGGLRTWVYKDMVAIQAAVINRSGFFFLGQGGAENATEFMVGPQIKPSDQLQIHVAGGSGLTEGYGTTDLRIFAGLVWNFKPEPPPPPPPEFMVAEPPPREPPPIEDIPIDPEPPAVVEWKPEELARIVENRIVIRDPIQFEFAKDVVLPISIPTLEYVAKLLNQEARIGHLVVEGHASEEGSYEYNFNLTNLRSLAVFKELIRAGVHPSRISYRGMGEVIPVRAGADEESLAANRRVEFKIVNQLAPGDEFPVYPSDILLPWNGTPSQAKNPPPPPPPEPPKVIEEKKGPDSLFDFSEESDTPAAPAVTRPPETPPTAAPPPPPPAPAPAEETKERPADPPADGGGSP